MRRSFAYTSGAGILTCCPSATPFGFTLGPTNPWMIAIAMETLDFRRGRILLPLWLLVPTFSLHIARPALAGPASAQCERSPTAHVMPKHNTHPCLRYYT